MWVIKLYERMVIRDINRRMLKFREQRVSGLVELKSVSSTINQSFIYCWLKKGVHTSLSNLNGSLFVRDEFGGGTLSVQKYP